MTQVTGWVKIVSSSSSLHRESEWAICGWWNGVLRADYNSRFYPNYLTDNSQLFWIILAIPFWNQTYYLWFTIIWISTCLLADPIKRFSISSTFLFCRALASATFTSKRRELSASVSFLPSSSSSSSLLFQVGVIVALSQAQYQSWQSSSIYHRGSRVPSFSSVFWKKKKLSARSRWFAVAIGDIWGASSVCQFPDDTKDPQ